MDIKGKVTVCTAGMEMLQISRSHSSSTAMVTTIVITTILLLIVIICCVISIIVIRRKRKAQLEDMRQLPNWLYLFFHFFEILLTKIHEIFLPTFDRYWNYIFYMSILITNSLLNIIRVKYQRLQTASLVVYCPLFSDPSLSRLNMVT